MKNVGVFVDVANIYYVVNKKFDGRKLDYKAYLERAIGKEKLYRAFAFGFYANNVIEPFITSLRLIGFETRFYPQHQNKAYLSLNVALAMEIVRTISKLDTVIIGSSDNNIGEIIKWIQEQGVKCEIYSCCIPKVLRDLSDSWMDINEEEIEVVESNVIPNA